MHINVLLDLLAIRRFYRNKDKLILVSQMICPEINLKKDFS